MKKLILLILFPVLLFAQSSYLQKDSTQVAAATTFGLGQTAGRDYVAGRYIATQTYVLYKIAIRCQAGGTPVQNFNFRIYSHNPSTNLPSAISGVVSATKNGSTAPVVAVGWWDGFTFSTGLQVTTDDTLWVVGYADGLNTSNYIQWKYATTAGDARDKRAYSANGSSWSSFADGTFGIRFYTGLIAAPTSLSPENAATGVSATPTLSWTGTGADSFYVKVSKSADLSSAVVDTAIKSNSLAVSLDYITQYYWAVAGKIVGDTTWSDTLSFTTKKLATPTNRVPAADAVYVDSATTFSWAANAEADSFYLQIGDSALASLVLDTAIVANSLLYTLVNDSSYWWSVAAKNNLDTSAWADTTKFTTGIAPLSSTIKRDFGGWPGSFKGFKK